MIFTFRDCAIRAIETTTDITDEADKERIVIRTEHGSIRTKGAIYIRIIRSIRVRKRKYEDTNCFYSYL